MGTQSSGGVVLVRVKRLLKSPVRWPRLSLRGAIVAIALLAVLFAALARVGATVERRRADSHRRYQSHFKRARWLYDDVIYGKYDKSRREQLIREAKEEDNLAEEYRLASLRLW